MKRKVKTAEDLTRLALSKGAIITKPDGRKFNTAKKTAKPRPKIKPKPPAPEPDPIPPAPPGPNEHEIALVHKMEQISESMNASAAVTRDLAIQIASKTETKSGPNGWTFDIERDENGYISRIVANPRRLN